MFLSKLPGGGPHAHASLCLHLPYCPGSCLMLDNIMEAYSSWGFSLRASSAAETVLSFVLESEMARLCTRSSLVSAHLTHDPYVGMSLPVEDITVEMRWHSQTQEATGSRLTTVRPDAAQSVCFIWWIFEGRVVLAYFLSCVSLLFKFWIWVPLIWNAASGFLGPRYFPLISIVQSLKASEFETFK